MIKTLRAISKQDKERFVVPKGVQDVIPVTAIYSDGIFRIGKDKFTKTFKFTDINYAVASREDKEEMFLEYSELLNSFDSGATTKITINNRRLNRLDFEKSILIPLKGNYLDEYRKEYNQMLLEKATGANSMVQDKYITVSVCKKNIEDARTYFSRVGNDMIAHLSKVSSAAGVRSLTLKNVCVFSTTSTVSVKKAAITLTSRKTVRKVTALRTISVPILWSLKRTISRLATDTAECFLCVSMRPISRTV